MKKSDAQKHTSKKKSDAKKKSRHEQKSLTKNKTIYFVGIIIILAAIYLLVPGSQSEASSVEEGIRLAREQDKLIFLYINSRDCTYCRLLEQQFGQSEEFQQIIEENYIWVTIDFLQNLSIARRFGLSGPPAMIILDQNGTAISGIPGYPPGGIQDVIAMLKEAL